MSERIPAPKQEGGVRILTESELKRLDAFFKSLAPGDLEIVGKMLWNAKKLKFKEWDKLVLGQPRGRKYNG